MGEGMKKWATFFTAIHFSTIPKPHFWVQYNSWVSPEPKNEPRSEGVAETPIVSKGLIHVVHAFILETVILAEIY